MYPALSVGKNVTVSTGKMFTASAGRHRQFCSQRTQSNSHLLFHAAKNTSTGGNLSSLSSI